MCTGGWRHGAMWRQFCVRPVYIIIDDLDMVVGGVFFQYKYAITEYISWKIPVIAAQMCKFKGTNY